MKRRKAAAVSAFILMSVLLAGCSAHTAAVDKDSADEPEKTKLQIAIFEGGYGREYWDAVCEAFEKENPDIDIVMQSNAEIGDIIRPTIIAGNPPDFVYLPSNNISGVTSALIKDHALADITDVMEEVEDKLIPGFLDTKSCQPYDDGKIYLAPMYYSPMGMWYNKDYFEKNSLEVPETWDEFFALGNDERCADRALFAYQGIYPAYMESVILSSIASSAGTEAMDACLNHEEGLGARKGEGSTGQHCEDRDRRLSSGRFHIYGPYSGPGRVAGRGSDVHTGRLVDRKRDGESNAGKRIQLRLCSGAGSRAG